jgi:adenylate kinase
VRGRVLLLGVQGSGKGTVARGLRRELGAIHLGAGDLLRRRAAEGGEWGAEIDARLSEGRGVDERISYGLLEQELSRLDGDSLLALDGYPRLAAQVPLLLKVLGEAPDLVVALEVSRPIAVTRLLGRETCADCGQSFGSEAPPRRAGTCDECGGKLERRQDDSQEMIARRRDAWTAESRQILSSLTQQCPVRRVDASGAVDEVLSEVRGLVEQTCN